MEKNKLKIGQLYLIASLFVMFGINYIVMGSVDSIFVVELRFQYILIPLFTLVSVAIALFFSVLKKSSVFFPLPLCVILFSLVYAQLLKGGVGLHVLNIPLLFYPFFLGVKGRFSHHK